MTSHVIEKKKTLTILLQFWDYRRFWNLGSSVKDLFRYNYRNCVLDIIIIDATVILYNDNPCFLLWNVLTYVWQLIMQWSSIDVPIFDCKHNIQDHQGYIFMRQGKFQCISFYKNAALCLSAQCLLLWTVDQSFGGSKVAFIGHKF